MRDSTLEKTPTSKMKNFRLGMNKHGGTRDELLEAALVDVFYEGSDLLSDLLGTCEKILNVQKSVTEGGSLASRREDGLD